MVYGEALSFGKRIITMFSTYINPFHLRFEISQLKFNVFQLEKIQLLHKEKSQRVQRFTEDFFVNLWFTS